MNEMEEILLIFFLIFLIIGIIKIIKILKSIFRNIIIIKNEYKDKGILKKFLIIKVVILILSLAIFLGIVIDILI